MWSRLLAVGMLAYALPSHAEVIYACVNNSSGTIKIVAESAVCPTGSSKTSWSNAAPPASDVYVARVSQSTQSINPSGWQPVVSVEVPSGNYLLLGFVGKVFSNTVPLDNVTCALQHSSNPADLVVFRTLTAPSVDVSLDDSMTLNGTIELASQETLSLSCQGFSGAVRFGDWTVNDAHIIAHAVGTIDDQSQP
jgi:hypothetical protein